MKKILYNQNSEWDGGNSAAKSATETAPKETPQEAAKPVEKSEYPPLHPRTPDPILRRTDFDGDEEKTVTGDPALIEYLNQPTPGDVAKLNIRHRKLQEIFKGQHGRISRSVKALVAAQIRLVGVALNAANNGPKPPRIGASEIALQHLGHANRPAARAKMIEQLEAAEKAFEAGDQGIFARMDIAPATRLAPEREWLLFQDGVQIAIGWLRQVAAKYELLKLRNFGVLYPSERIAEIKHEHGNCTDPVKIRALNDEAANLVSPTIQGATRGLRNLLQVEWQKVSEVNQFLLQNCVDCLEAAKEEYTEQEKLLFICHPMGLARDYKSTIISSSFDKAIAEFKGVMTQVQGNHHMPQLNGPEPMNGENTTLQTVFALPLLAESSPRIPIGDSGDK